MKRNLSKVMEKNTKTHTWEGILNVTSAERPSAWCITQCGGRFRVVSHKCILMFFKFVTELYNENKLKSTFQVTAYALLQARDQIIFGIGVKTEQGLRANWACCRKAFF